MTTDWTAVVNDPQVHVVIELVGGTTLAKTMILTALKLGKPVITANKALISAQRARNCLPPPGNSTGPIFITRPASRAGFPSSKCCARGWWEIGSRTFTASSTWHLQLHPLPALKLEGDGLSHRFLAEAQRLGYAEADSGDGR